MPPYAKLLLPLLGLLATVDAATAQTYQYTARTAEPVKQSGAVTAGSLTWQCSGTTCTISGPWARPGVSACATLAGEVGRIVEYGHPGSKLTSKQLTQCNQGLASTPRVRLNQNTARQVQPKTTVRVPLDPKVQRRLKLPPVDAGGAAGGGAAGGGAAPQESGGLLLGLEEGSHEDYTLYVKTTEAIRFHGTYEGTHPAPPGPRIRWTGDTLRLPALRHTGTDDPGERTVPTGTAPADQVVETSVSGRYIEVPLQLAKIPQRVTFVAVKCSAGVVPAGTGIYVAGPFSAQNTIGFAEGTFWRRPPTEGDWSLSTTARMPLNLRPYISPEDIHSVVCSLHLAATRLNGTGIDHSPFERATDPASEDFVPGLAAAGTSTFKVQADLED